jgi:hypothetical protein
MHAPFPILLEAQNDPARIVHALRAWNAVPDGTIRR